MIASDLPAYRLDLQYLGTSFLGWQSQPQGTAVQDHLEKALSTMLRHPVRVTGAARTDTGVHAEQQVAVFRTAVAYDERKWLKSLQGLLPSTVGVASIRTVGSDFHPIRSAQAKVYRYRLWLGVTRNPLIAPFAWQIVSDLDVTALAEAARDFVGLHDFTSFCAIDSTAKTRQREIYEVVVEQQGPLVDIWVSGSGFLKQMVRTMVGTLVDVGLGKRDAKSLPAVLAAKDRQAAGMTAPALGLSLVQICYGERPTVAELRTRLSAGFCVKLWP